MELSDSKIKKFLIFSQKKGFLIFPEMEPAFFIPSSKNKNNLTVENSSCFSKRKLFLYFEKWNFLMF